MDESHGEVEAVPILIRRTVQHVRLRQYADVLRPTKQNCEVKYS